MRRQERPTTIALLGSNTAVGRALCLLLRGAGYDTKLIERDPAGLADGLMDGVDLLLLSPERTNGTRDAILGIVKDNPRTAQMPVLALSSVIAGEVLADESGTRLVPWPSPIAVLTQEIEAVLAPSTGEQR